MSFLDNLESTLKNLESREERDPSANAKRESERAKTLAAAPWAERLKQSPYTQQLMNEAAAAGHKIRTKIYMAWLGTTFRLEARDRRLELARQKMESWQCFWRTTTRSVQSVSTWTRVRRAC